MQFIDVIDGQHYW